MKLRDPWKIIIGSSWLLVIFFFIISCTQLNEVHRRRTLEARNNLKKQYVTMARSDSGILDSSSSLMRRLNVGWLTCCNSAAREKWRVRASARKSSNQRTSMESPEGMSLYRCEFCCWHHSLSQRRRYNLPSSTAWHATWAPPSVVISWGTSCRHRSLA